LQAKVWLEQVQANTDVIHAADPEIILQGGGCEIVTDDVNHRAIAPGLRDGMDGGGSCDPGAERSCGETQPQQLGTAAADALHTAALLESITRADGHGLNFSQTKRQVSGDAPDEESEHHETEATR
jgi:hypothetical protein